MYSFVVGLTLALLYHSQVEGGCLSCPYDTSKSQCNDVYNGTHSDACYGTIDMRLCSKYEGGYTVFCDSGYGCSWWIITCKAGSVHHDYPAAMFLCLFACSSNCISGLIVFI